AAAKKKAPANSNKKHEFKANDHVVYPTHGVGKIMRVEEQEVAGHKLELFVITFEKDKMTLRVPVAKAKSVGMRKLSSPDVVATALNTLKGRTHQAHHVVPPRAGIRSEDQFGRPRVDRRSGARPAPRQRSAGTKLFRTPALRSRARPHGARSRRHRADRRTGRGETRRRHAAKESGVSQQNLSKKARSDPGLFLLLNRARSCDRKRQVSRRRMMLVLRSH